MSSDLDRDALLERVRSAELVSEISQAIASQRSVTDLVKTAIEKVRSLCDACGASLLLVDPRTGELVFDRVDGACSDQLGHAQVQAGHGIAWKVGRRKQPLLVPDIAVCPDFDGRVDALTGFATHSVIAVPLLFRGELLGVLEAVREQGKASFGPAELQRLGDLAPHIAIAVHQARIDEKLRTVQNELISINSGLERQVAERTEMISRGKREWERTFDAISDPIALQDGFVVRRANLAWAKAVGLPITEVPGKKCHELLAGRATPCPNCPLLKARSDALSAEVETRGATWRFSGFWLSDEPSDRSVVVQYRDVTGQKALEERAREGERLIALGQLASGAAHEINNPIGFVGANLQSFKQLLADARAGTAETEDFDDAREMIEESLEGVRRVTEIVTGLRDFARLELVSRDPSNVNAAVTRLTAKLPEADRPRVTLEATGLAQIPPLQLDQALGHILKNALQAVPNGRAVRVRTMNHGDEVRIEVHDDGAGIPRANLRRIFEPFFTTRGVGKGLGLGLTAAYGIIKRAGGDIEVASEVGAGSTFTVRLRAKPAS